MNETTEPPTPEKIDVAELEKEQEKLEKAKEELKTAESAEEKKGILARIERIEEKITTIMTAWKYFIEKSKEEETQKQKKAEHHQKQKKTVF
jgi:phenylalanyl-tRNA synthetase alpha subunit